MTRPGVPDLTAELEKLKGLDLEPVVHQARVHELIRQYAEMLAREKDSLVARFVLAHPDIPIDEVCIVTKVDGLVHTIWVERRRAISVQSNTKQANVTDKSAT